jgi:hypothetical protein
MFKTAFSFTWQIPVAVPSAAAKFLELRVGIPPGAWMSVVSVVFCKVEISGLGRPLVKGSTRERGVSEGDRGDSIMRKTWPTWGCCTMEGGRMSSYCLELIRNMSQVRNKGVQFFWDLMSHLKYLITHVPWDRFAFIFRFSQPNYSP